MDNERNQTITLSKLKWSYEYEEVVNGFPYHVEDYVMDGAIALLFVPEGTDKTVIEDAWRVLENERDIARGYVATISQELFDKAKTINSVN